MPIEPEQSDRDLRDAELSELRQNLRTPLNHVLGYTEMLIEDASETSNSRALVALRHLHSAALAMQSDLVEALSNRQSVLASEVEGLFAKMRPRAERVLGCVGELRNHAESDSPPEWLPDIQRLGAAANALLQLICGADVPKFEETPASGNFTVPASAPRILVVDDNAIERTMMARRLRHQGYHAVEARNGSEALDYAATESYQLILLDLMMPVMDGFQFLERAKNDRHMRPIPVMVLATADETDDVARAIEMGAEDYMLKPFNAVLLRTRISALFERKRLYEEVTSQRQMASAAGKSQGGGAAE